MAYRDKRAGISKDQTFSMFMRADFPAITIGWKENDVSDPYKSW